MKALTIYQPWASLIIAGAKPYEFRKWNPRERGGAHADLIGQRIVIHASAKKIDIEEVRLLADLKRLRNHPLAKDSWAETCLLADNVGSVLGRALLHDLPMSAGLGTVILGEPRLGTEIAEEFGVPRANDSDRDEHANWGWPMLKIHPWHEAIPMRGLQGFWNWPTPDQFTGGL